MDHCLKEPLLILLEPAFSDIGYSQKYLPLIEKHIDNAHFEIHVIGSQSGLNVLKNRFKHVYSIPFYPNADQKIKLYLGYLAYLFNAFFVVLKKSSESHAKVIVSLAGHPYSGLIVSVAAKLMGKKSIVRISEPTRFLVKKRYTLGPLISKVIGLLERVTFSFADVVIANRDMQWYSAKVAEKQVLLSQGINLSVFNRFAKPILNSGSYPKLISVSRLDKQKNIDSVIRAVGLLKNKYPNIKYYILGEGPDERELHRIAAGINGGKGSIFFCGSVEPEEIPSFLRSSDFFVLPSCIEGLPSAALEAMACGIPIILSSTQFGWSEWFVNKENAMIVSGDPESIIEAVEELLADPELKNRLIHNGLNYVVKYHDSSKTRQRFYSAYKQCLASSQSSFPKDAKKAFFLTP